MFPAWGQNPGNVGTTNLTAWFLPDALPLGVVQSWSTTYPIGASQITVTDASLPYPIATNIPAGNVSNYNTTVEFNANSTGALKGLSNSGSLDLLENSNSNSQGTFFCAYYKPSSGPNHHMLLWNNGTHAIQLRNLGNSGRMAIGKLPSNSPNATRNWAEDFVPTIISYKGNRSSSNSMNAYERGANFTTSSASQSSGLNGLYMGYYPNNNNSPYNGYIHEYIFYDRDLTDDEMRRVHSYLGIKYGATLDLIGGGQNGDYTSSSDALIWDASNNASYHNNVVGLARDDAQGLLQKQSHAFNDNYRVYLGLLAPANIANIGLFSADQSFVMFGQNNGSGCANLASNNEAPVGVQSKLSREWKVTKTNFSDQFSMDIRIDTCNVAGSLNGVILPTNFRLLVDNDGNFSDAAVHDMTSGLTFTMNGTYLTVSGISATHIPNNSTKYLSIGYNTIEAYFVGNDSICEGDSALVHLNIQFAQAPTTILYMAGSTVHTIIGAVNGDSMYLSPSNSTTYTVLGSKNFLDCCGNANNNNFQLTVHNRPQVLANASDSSLCLGESAQLYGSGATNYSWDSGVTDLDSVNPLNTTTYTLIGSDNFQCSDTSSVTIQVNSLPNVVASADTTIMCFGDSVQISANGANSFIWSHGLPNNSYLSPLATAKYYVVGQNSFGCMDADSIEISVLSLPIIEATATSVGVCEGDSTALVGQGANIYSWSDGRTDLMYFEPGQTDWYHVIGTDINNCVNSDSIYIEYYPAVDFYLGGDTSICPQNPIFLGANNVFAAYDWSTGSQSAVINVNYDGEFELTVTDFDGCTYTDQQTVTILEDCLPTIYVPNSFTPDGDEFNAYLRTTGTYVYDFEIKIYNRWGELMFVSEDMDVQWDGTYGNELCGIGLYTYILRYRLGEESVRMVQRTGTIRLLR